MSVPIPRMRMFAGPNGSGKTTVKNRLNKPDNWFGLYINPDDLETTIRQFGILPINSLGLNFDLNDVRTHFASSTFLKKAGLSDSANLIQWTENSIDFRNITFTSYHASVLSDFIRRQALIALRSFSFETVMSAEDKVLLLREARSQGYRTYLYFVATVNPIINVQRVMTRVASGGHDVPEDKIIARYYRSLVLLKRAIPNTDRAFFFDTSKETAMYFAEIVDGNRIKLHSDEIPTWFQPIWDSIPSDT
jgi:predicted ABC-type ATPase